MEPFVRIMRVRVEAQNDGRVPLYLTVRTTWDVHDQALLMMKGR